MIFVISAPEQWTNIPVPVKLLKLIINELGTLLESAAAGDEHEDGDSDEVCLQALVILCLKYAHLWTEPAADISPIPTSRNNISIGVKMAAMYMAPASILKSVCQVPQLGSF